MKRIKRTLAAISLAIVGFVTTFLMASPAQAISANPTVSWSDTSITNGESTALIYTMSGVSSYAAQWYDGVYQGCFWKSSASQNLPTTYETARTTSSHATSWWIGLFATDCTSTQPLQTDAYSFSELTLTPVGPYGPDAITSSDTSETSITLNWVADTYATGYRVYQDGVLIATLGASDVVYTVNGLTAGTSYVFDVVGFNDDFGGEGTSVTLSTSKPALPSTGMDATAAGVLGFGALFAIAVGGALAFRRRT